MAESIELLQVSKEIFIAFIEKGYLRRTSDTQDSYSKDCASQFVEFHKIIKEGTIGSS